MDVNVELRLSGDGSSTLYRPDIDEHYHSIHGAVNESLHVFISAGLHQIKQNPATILEIGFGTGLNALLTLLNKPDGLVYYHSVEKYPLDKSIVKSINYPCVIKDNKAGIYFQLIHDANWKSPVKIRADFILSKFESDLLLFDRKDYYDLIYFDAFAPEKQPELWSPEVFISMYKAMKNNGILTTYCAKGSVRRAMQAAGFFVERLPGPTGKREILRAIKLIE